MLLDDKLRPIEASIKNIQYDFKKVERRTTSIELTLENETNKAIQIIAEGHLDLSRKLDDALRIENEKEMMLLRVNRLESELQKIKQQITA